MGGCEREEWDIRTIECFLIGGASALLLAVPRALPSLGFVSFFAFLPVLSSFRNRLRESALLGVFFGLSYGLVTAPAVRESFDSLLAKSVLLALLFASYMSIVRLSSKRFGHNPIIVALLWLPFGAILCRYKGLCGSLIPENQSALFLRIGSLFGLLFVSFFVILVNSLLLELSSYFLRRYRASFRRITGPREQILPACQENWVHQGFRFTHFPSRAPPLF